MPGNKLPQLKDKLSTKGKGGKGGKKKQAGKNQGKKELPQ
jgi:hypothetical protein